MKKFLWAATFVILGFAGAAHAATLDITLGLTNATNVYSVGAGSAFAGANIDLATTGQLVLNNNSLIITPPTSLTNQYAKPTGPIFGSGGGSYLAVLGLPTPVPGSGVSTFTLSPGQAGFDFTWGTIDNYNTLTLTDSRSVVYTITGTNILSHILGSTPGQTQSDVFFTDPFGTIKSAVFSSANNSFEVANFGQTAVPLPAALPLFAAALFGLFCIARQRARKTA